MKKRGMGFTLVELLIVVAIITLLIALLLPSLGKARILAKQVRGASDMHQMMVAYHAYTLDNNGWMLPGFLPDSPTWTVMDAQYGITISGHPATRYPWRFLPYIKDWRILFNSEQLSSDTVNTFSYQLSLLPRFGLNSVYVGGDHGFNGFDVSGNPNFSGPAIFREMEARQPNNLVVFAETACYTNGKLFTFPASTLPSSCPSDDLGQYFQLQPPQASGTAIWHVANNQLVVDSNAILGAPHSFVSERPVIGFFDGHAEAMRMSDLTDMRMWSAKPIGP